jgi:hypothetical protein
MRESGLPAELPLVRVGERDDRDVRLPELRGMKDR